MKKNIEWNPNFFNSELKNFLIKTKIGFFYFLNFNLEDAVSDLYTKPELQNFYFNLKNKLNIGKWDRWLYRYSFFHRKDLKNTHKITLVKKLINSGFLNNNL
jgi:hypothetical protein